MPPCKGVSVRQGRNALVRHPYKHRIVCNQESRARPSETPVPQSASPDVSAQNLPVSHSKESHTPSPPPSADSSPAPTPPPSPEVSDLTLPAIIGDKYLLLDQVEGSTLYRCVNIHTREQRVTKVLSPEAGRIMVNAHLRLRNHPHVSPLTEVVWGADEDRVYLMLPPAVGGDLHLHVRSRRRLRESEARRLFRQMAAAVRDSHANGVVLRDLKLRKFVFADKDRTHLRLESLEDALLIGNGSMPLSDDSYSYVPAFPTSYTCPEREEIDARVAEQDDTLEDKRGCPAYVSPEILRSGEKYSGRAADMWSLGVVLYTMLVGRYPFNDSEHASLFAKISRGRFGLPDTLSARARCLIRSLLRRNPKERLSAADVLLHPWLAPSIDGNAREEEEDDEVDGPGSEGKTSRKLPSPRSGRDRDQIVPDWSGD